MIEAIRTITTTLNGICPYFTMFPLTFPFEILAKHAEAGNWVADPFCGRGTTNYASRILGLPSVGIDSSPVAVALSQAKLANTTPAMIIRAAGHILEEIAEPVDLPEGEFWEWAYHQEVLHILCRLREGLIRNCRSDARKALRAVIMGALHGPRQKTRPSYFSNQSQRTYAPKPRYAVEYWKRNDLQPEPVKVLEIIGRRAKRYYDQEATRALGRVVQGDSRKKASFARVLRGERIRWVITSPPYYGMRTYLPDQWLRLWFLGGKAHVDYSVQGQVEHTSPDVFAGQLRQVWRNIGDYCADDAQMVIRFGGINDRKAEPLSLLKRSLDGTDWKVRAIENAGSASRGRRQAMHFSGTNADALEELDFWVDRNG